MLARAPTDEWKRKHGGLKALRPAVAAQLLAHAMGARCAALCAERPGCHFFTVGQVDTKYIVSGASWEAGVCQQEYTKLASCPEGFEKGRFNFYELLQRHKPTPSPTPLPPTPPPTPPPVFTKAPSCTESLLAWAHLHFKRRNAVPTALTARAARAAADRLGSDSSATMSAHATHTPSADDDDDDHGAHAPPDYGGGG